MALSGVGGGSIAGFQDFILIDLASALRSGLPFSPRPTSKALGYREIRQQTQGRSYPWSGGGKPRKMCPPHTRPAKRHLMV